MQLVGVCGEMGWVSAAASEGRLLCEELQPYLMADSLLPGPVVLCGAPGVRVLVDPVSSSQNIVVRSLFASEDWTCWAGAWGPPKSQTKA